MTRYQLARLVEWSGGKLETRKRLQKVVFLLQAAGCPFDVRYTLHLYGPYSRDVAELTDQMVQANLLDEKEGGNSRGGRTFSYELSEGARDQLKEFDELPDDSHRFKNLARRLLRDTSLQQLEYGATVAYFRGHGKSWEDAQGSAAKFKHEEPDGAVMREATALARGVMEAEELG